MRVEKLRQILALLLVGTAAFVVTSLVTFSPDDYAANVHPHEAGQKMANR